MVFFSSLLVYLTLRLFPSYDFIVIKSCDFGISLQNVAFRFKINLIICGAKSTRNSWLSGRTLEHGFRVLHNESFGICVTCF